VLFGGLWASGDLIEALFRSIEHIRPELHKSLIDTETADVRQINTDKRR
jgi:hypothetical protein